MLAGAAENGRPSIALGGALSPHMSGSTSPLADVDVTGFPVLTLLMPVAGSMHVAHLGAR